MLVLKNTSCHKVMAQRKAYIVHKNKTLTI